MFEFILNQVDNASALQVQSRKKLNVWDIN